MPLGQKGDYKGRNARISVDYCEFLFKLCYIYQVLGGATGNLSGRAPCFLVNTIRVVLGDGTCESGLSGGFGFTEYRAICFEDNEY